MHKVLVGVGGIAVVTCLALTSTGSASVAAPGRSPLGRVPAPVAQPRSARPEAAHPRSAQPETAQPGAAQSAAAQSAAAQAPGGQVVLSPRSPIKHVVIIYQENHTFDDLLGAYCLTRTNPCNGYDGKVTMADGRVAPNIVQPDIVPEVDHSPKAQRAAMHNKWYNIGNCEAPTYKCVSHVDPARIPNMTALADTFGVSDATFAAGRSASFGAHVTLGAGTFDGFSGNNPDKSVRGVKAREGWGCSSRRDVLWGPQKHETFQPSCVPDQQGRGPYRRTKVPYTATIMERMEQAGLSWHIYEGPDNDQPLVGPWSVCTYFAWCALKRFQNEYDSSRRDFVTAAGNGTLPNLSILLPTGGSPIGGVSQHNSSSISLGDNYIGDMVGAAMQGPDWNSTAIFITYDDCGCFFDHVTPPNKHYGLRNPLVIISPYAKPQGTDSTTAIQPYSMLAFTEHVFGLRPLTTEVSSSYDYANAFDFSQRPLQGPAMTTTPVPRSEWARLARLAPGVARDPA